MRYSLPSTSSAVSLRATVTLAAYRTDPSGVASGRGVTEAGVAISIAPMHGGSHCSVDAVGTGSCLGGSPTQAAIERPTDEGDAEDSSRAASGARSER
jgi:hypothetical protein